MYPPAASVHSTSTLLLTIDESNFTFFDDTIDIGRPSKNDGNAIEDKADIL